MIQLHLTSSNIQPRADNVYDTSSSPSWNILMKRTLTCTIWNIWKRLVITHMQHSIEMKYGNRCWWIKYLSSSHLQATFNITSTLPTFAAMKWYKWSIKANNIFKWYMSYSLMFPSPYDNQEISNKILERIINQYRDSAPFNFQQHPAQSWQRVRHVFISIMKYFDEKNTDMYHMKYMKTPRHHTYTTLYWNEIWKSLLMNKVPQLQSSPSNVQHHFNLTYICCYEVIWMEYQGQ